MITLERKYYITFLIVILILGLFVTWYTQNKIIGYKVYSVDYTVGDYSGFNLDEDAIHFGTILPETTVKRKFVINTDKKVLVKMNINGLKDIKLTERSVFLEANESKKIELILKTGKNITEGYYHGKLIITYYKI